MFISALFPFFRDCSRLQVNSPALRAKRRSSQRLSLWANRSRRYPAHVTITDILELSFLNLYLNVSCICVLTKIGHSYSMTFYQISKLLGFPYLLVRKTDHRKHHFLVVTYFCHPVSPLTQIKICSCLLKCEAGFHRYGRVRCPRSKSEFNSL